MICFKAWSFEFGIYPTIHRLRWRPGRPRLMPINYPSSGSYGPVNPSLPKRQIPGGDGWVGEVKSAVEVTSVAPAIEETFWDEEGERGVPKGPILFDGALYSFVSNLFLPKLCYLSAQDGFFLSSQINTTIWTHHAKAKRLNLWIYESP